MQESHRLTVNNLHIANKFLTRTCAGFAIIDTAASATQTLFHGVLLIAYHIVGPLGLFGQALLPQLHGLGPTLSVSTQQSTQRGDTYAALTSASSCIADTVC